MTQGGRPRRPSYRTVFNAALDHLLDREGRGHRMPDVGVPVQERAAAAAQALDDGAVHEHRADRLVARAETGSAQKAITRSGPACRSAASSSSSSIAVYW